MGYPKVCNLWHNSGVRYMRTCQACPKNYPWTGNTGIFNSLADKPIVDRKILPLEKLLNKKKK